MPRTLNPIAHAVRRDAFLDAAQALIVAKGYEALSIQDVLEAVGSSKGAFYHYFDSKSALLDGVVSRMVDAALAGLAPSMADPTLELRDASGTVLASNDNWRSTQQSAILATGVAPTRDARSQVSSSVRAIATPLLKAGFDT